MRLEYLTELEVVRLAGRWRLVSPLRVRLDTDELSRAGVVGALGPELTVPKGFETDFASVPRLPLAFLLTGDTAHESAVVHDWLYANGAPRELADQVFRAGMLAEGVSGWRRGLMWAAVRVFGSWAWRARQDAPGEAQGGGGGA